MPLVDKLLAATIKYLQKKQQALRKKSKKKKAKTAKRKTGGRKSKPRAILPKKATKKPKHLAKTRLKPALKSQKPPLLPVKNTSAKGEPDKLTGVITHYFSRIEVVVIKLSKAGLRVGDTIRIKGDATDFKQRVKSLQIESVDVVSAKKGDLVGLKVVQKAKVGDKVYFVA